MKTLAIVISAYPLIGVFVWVIAKAGMRLQSAKSLLIMMEVWPFFLGILAMDNQLRNQVVEADLRVLSFKASKWLSRLVLAAAINHARAW